VLTRGERNQQLARELGADSIGGAANPAPEPLDGAAILFAPAGELVPTALRSLDAGGTLAAARIWLSDIPGINYDAEPVRERRRRSVTADTRRDGEQFLRLADRFDIRATIVAYPMSAAPTALRDLAHGRYASSNPPSQLV
jgi:propanol-preferring alcohol dehydrogenase